MSIDGAEVKHALSISSYTSTKQLSPEDVLGRQKRLSNSSASRKCRLVVKESTVEVTDVASGELLEQLPLQLVRQPISYENEQRSISLLLFCCDLDDCSEVHAYHCEQSAARRLAKLLYESSSRLKQQLHAAPTQQLQQQQRQQEQQQQEQQQPKSSEYYVQVKDVLNLCIEDLEEFTQRLVTDKKDIKRHSSLSAPHPQLRRSLPPQSEFELHLQKLKLALNLIAELEGRIHRPNAAELMHNMVAVLQLLRFALSNDAAVRDCFSPALTDDAVSLLRHCLNSGEFERWMQLGDAWCRPMRDWSQQLREKYIAFIPRLGHRQLQPKLPAKLIGKDL